MRWDFYLFESEVQTLNQFLDGQSRKRISKTDSEIRFASRLLGPIAFKASLSLAWQNLHRARKRWPGQISDEPFAHLCKDFSFFHIFQLLFWYFWERSPGTSAERSTHLRRVSHIPPWIFIDSSSALWKAAWKNSVCLCEFLICHVYQRQK